MFRRIATLAVVVLLGGCQTSQVNHDYDASRDFGAYRSWAWKDPALQYRRMIRASRATSPNSASARP